MEASDLAATVRDLRNATISRSQLLQLIVERDSPELRVMLTEADTTFDLLCSDVLRCAKEPDRTPEERSLLYATVSVARTAGRIPYRELHHRSLTARFSAAAQHLRVAGQQGEDVDPAADSRTLH